MKIADMRVGQRVRCTKIKDSRFANKEGTVARLTIENTINGTGDIGIKWDDGTNDGSGWWNATCFEPIQDQPLQPKTSQSHICKCGIFRGDCVYHKD